MSDPHNTDYVPGSNWTPRAYRNLKIAVVVMGVLLVVGFAAVFATIIARLAATGERPAVSPPQVELTQQLGRLLHADSEVVSTTVEGNRLALVVRRPEGLSVIVIDLRNGEIIGVISGE